MVRVLRPGGRLAVAVWAALEHSPGYAALTDLIERLFGAQAAAAMRDPYALGDRDTLRALVANPDLQDVAITTYGDTARFPSIAALVYTEVKGWTLANILTEAQVAVLQQQAEQELRPFVAVDGTVAFLVTAHIVTATKSG
jgi:hypothetical protein